MNGKNHCTQTPGTEREDRPVVQTRRATRGFYYSFENDALPVGSTAKRARWGGPGVPVPTVAKFITGCVEK